MSQKIEAARTVASITGSAATYVATGTSAAGLAHQLNQTHPFLYLDLPIWIFFVGAFMLAIVGSFGSLYIDTMREANLSYTQKFVNLSLGFMTGLIGAFIILPAFTAAPPMPLLLLTSLVMSFVGTVAIRNIGELVRSEELWDAAKVILTERLQTLVSLVFGGRKK